jgi:peroxiredoxin
MKTVITLMLALLSPVNAWAQLSNSPIPNFTATALTGEKVSAAQLIGQPTILIVTPSTDAPSTPACRPTRCARTSTRPGCASETCWRSTCRSL